MSDLYHQPQPQTSKASWYDYAHFVIEQARKHGESLAVQRLEPIPTSAYRTPAKRPLNSRLDTRKLRESFAIHFPAWEEGVADVVEELTGVHR